MVFCTKRGLKSLQTKVEETARVYKAKLTVLKRNHGSVVIGDVKVENVLGGMRGIKGLLTQTSELDAMDGITFRGLTIN
jgi:citrate synthase